MLTVRPNVIYHDEEFEEPPYQYVPANDIGIPASKFFNQRRLLIAKLNRKFSREFAGTKHVLVSGRAG